MTVALTVERVDDDRWSKLDAEIREVLARSDIYRTLSWAFLYPDPQPLSALCQTVAALARRRADIPGHEAVIGKLERVASLADSVANLSLEHDCIFGHAISTECPPYETQYGPNLIFAQTQRMGDIAAFFRAFCVQVSPDAHERVDHISAELEFLSVMAFREAVASIENDRQHLAAVRQAERKFFVEHLAMWALSFAERLARKARAVTAPDGGFYAALAECLAAWTADELRQFDIPIETIVPIEPVQADFEPEGCNFACGSSSEPALVNLPGFDA